MGSVFACAVIELVILWQRQGTDSWWVYMYWVFFCTVPEVFLQRQVAFERLEGTKSSCYANHLRSVNQRVDFVNGNE